MQVDCKELSRYLEARLPETLELLETMVGINSFTTNPDGVRRLAEVTAETFAALGFTARTLPTTDPELSDHLLLEKPCIGGSEGPTIAMVSHLDTVFPAEEEVTNHFHWRPEGNRIYGPGTVDIKGGTVIIYMILSALKELYSEVYAGVNWLVLLNAAEERLEPEFGDAAQTIIPADALACLVFEGGRLRGDRFFIVAARKGMVIYTIEAEGKAAHAGSNHKGGASAITQLARTVDAVAGMTDYDRNLTFNIGAIKGGTVRNRVAHFALAAGEMRAFSPELLDEGIRRLKRLEQDNGVQTYKGDFACQTRVEILRRWGPWPPNERTDALLEIWRAAAKEMGYKVERQERGGLSDGNFLWDHVPTLDGLGPSGGNAHCSERSPDGKKDQEYLELSSIVPKATLNTLAILRLVEPHV